MREVPSPFEEVSWEAVFDLDRFWEGLNGTYPGFRSYFGRYRPFPGAGDIIECTDYRRIPDEEREFILGDVAHLEQRFLLAQVAGSSEGDDGTEGADEVHPGGRPSPTGRTRHDPRPQYAPSVHLRG